MNKFLLKLLAYPLIGKFVLKAAKKRILKPFQIPRKDATEKQREMLRSKFRKMERTEIGRKLGINEGSRLQKLPLTTYEFYEPFYNNPSPRAFMYPLESYERMRTSGTAGKEKWFMVPKTYITKFTFETGIPSLLLATHDGEKITLEFGDTIYVNSAPRPFGLGVIISSVAGSRKEFPLFNIVPNLNLSFEDKVKYFINNSDTIDFAVEQASILVSRVLPAMKNPLKLKGLFCQDTAIAEAHLEEITEFAGIPPRTTYNATETLGCSIVSLQYPLGFFFDWRRGVFEFASMKNGNVDANKIVEMDEVAVGKVYELVYTSFETELTRYDTLNAFKCVGKGDNALGIDYPIFRFHSRLEETISLHNFTRISEDELVAAFRGNSIPLVEFTTRVDIEKGLEHLVIYVEIKGRIKAEEIQELVHNYLYDNDKDYRDLVDFYGYIPIEIRLIPNGVFAKYLSGKTAAIAKVDRMNMQDEEFEKLVRLIK